jgi:hypothetical protein
MTPVLAGAEVSPVVAFTVNDRPGYLAETLESWSRVRGIEKAHLIFRAEPGHPGVLAVCRDVSFAAEVTVTINPRRLGPGGNPWRAIEAGFATGTGYVILAEDDTPVSDDILEYLDWARREYAADPSVLVACAFQHHRRPGGPAGALLLPCFYSQVFGVWRDRWETELRDDWDFDYRYRGYDWNLRDRFMQARDFRAVFPCESRSQVSGEHGGTHLHPGAEYQAHLSDCFAPHYDPVAFGEITLDDPGPCGYCP